MKRTKKSVSALIVALCMLVQLIPAFPVQTASAAGETSDIVLDFYNQTGPGFKMIENTFTKNKQTSVTDVDGDSANVLYVQNENGRFVVEFEVTESGYYKYDPAIWISDLRPLGVNFIVETPKNEGSEEMVSLLCQNATVTYKVKDTDGVTSNNAPSNALFYKIGKPLEYNRVINSAGDTADFTITGTNPKDNMPYFDGYVYLTKGTNRFVFNSTGGFFGLNKVEFTKVDNTAGDFVIDFTKKANGTSTAYKDATLAYNGWRLNSAMYDAEGALITTGVFKSNETSLAKGYAYMNFNQKWGDVLALDILVPADGTYDVTLTAEYNRSLTFGGTMLFSIDGTRLSAVNAEAECGDILLGGLYLTEGPHKLEIKLVGSTQEYQRTYLGMQKLSFKYVKEATAFTEAVITSGMVDGVATTANVNDHGWAINKEKTASALYSALEKGSFNYRGIDSLKFDGEFGETLAIDVKVPKDDTYNVSAIFQEKANMSGVFDLYVDDNDDDNDDDIYLGRVYNDPNVDYSGSNNPQSALKGFKNVDLKAGTNTFKFVRNADDLIGAGSRAYFGLQSITLTPATDNEAQWITIDAPDTINVGEEDDVSVTMEYADGSYDSDGVEVELRPAYYSIQNPEYSEGSDVSPFIPANDNDTEVTAATLENGTLTAEEAGRFVIEATATIAGKLYTAQKHVYVNAAPEMTGEAEAGAPFGEIYAYVQEYKDDTYKVTFIGGVKKTEGFEEIGYEITVGDNTVDVGSGYVYEKITVNGGTTYTAEEDFQSKYIFIGAKDGIKAGETVTAKPYVMLPDENDDGEPEKEYYGNVELTLSFEY